MSSAVRAGPREHTSCAHAPPWTAEAWEARSLPLSQALLCRSSSTPSHASMLSDVRSKSRLLRAAAARPLCMSHTGLSARPATSPIPVSGLQFRKIGIHPIDCLSPHRLAFTP